MTSEDLRAKSLLGSNWNDHSCRHWLLRIVAWWRFNCCYRAPNHEHPRFTLRSMTLFRVCSCVYVNFSFMKRQQKLSLFFEPKRVATESEDQGELEETNDEGGEISTTASQPAQVAELPVEPTAPTSTTVRKFRSAWKNSALQHWRKKKDRRIFTG